MPVITFLNLKGGVAKTTNAVAVAETFADAGCSVLVVDADHQCAAGELLLGQERMIQAERRRRTLHDLLAAMLDRQFDESHFDSFIERGASNIRGGMSSLAVLPCSLRIEDFSTNMAKAQRGHRSQEEWYNFLRAREGMLRKWLVENFDYTIVDCPPSISLQVRTLLKVSDAYIVPTIPDRLSLQGSVRLVDRLRRTGIKKVGLGTLWSLYRSNNELHRRCIERAWTSLSVLPRPFQTIIPNATAIARAAELGSAPASLSSKYEPKFAGMFKQLCSEIIGRLHTAFET